MAEEYQLVELPDGNVIEFPATMSPDEIGAVLDGVKQEVPKHQTFGKEKATKTLKEELPEIGGSVVGSLVGMGAGIPGMVAGALIGGAAGKAYQELYKSLTSDPEAAKTSSEAAERIGEAGLAQGLLEGLGAGLTGVGGKLLKPYAKKVSEKTIRSMALLEKYMPRIDTIKQPISTYLKKKVPGILPAEAHRGYITGLMHDIAEGSIWGGRTIQNYNEIVRSKAITKMFDDFLDGVSGRINPDDLGELIGTTVTARFEDLKDTYTTPLYNKVSKMLGDDVLIPTQSLKNSVAREYETAVKVGGLAAAEAGDDIVKVIMGIDDHITFDVARNLRTRLRVAATKAAASDKKAPAIRISKSLQNKLDKAITKTLKGSGDALPHTPKAKMREAHELWRNANSIYKQLSERYNDDFVRKLVKMAEGMGPQKVMGRIVEKANPRTIDRMKRILDPETFSKVRRWAIEDALSKAPLNEAGEIGWKSLEKAFYGRTGIQNAAMKKLFTGAQRQQIRTMVNTLKMTQRRTKGAMGVVIKLVQGAAAGNMVFKGEADWKSVGVLVGPEMFARLVLNPTGAKLLTQGFSLPQGHQMVMPTAVKLGNLIRKIEKRYGEKE